MSVSQLCRAWFWLAFTAVGLVAGAMGGVVFIAAFGNVHAGGWSLVSCVPSSAGLHLHYLHKGRRVSLYYSEKSLKGMTALGIALTVASVIAALVYVAESIKLSIPMEPIGDNLYLGAVMAIMVAKWSISLAIFSWKYKVLYEEAETNILL